MAGVPRLSLARELFGDGTCDDSADESTYRAPAPGHHVSGVRPSPPNLRSHGCAPSLGVTLKPAFALVGWVAFTEVAAGTAMVMGDLVLTEDEVAPVMRALRVHGILVSALHSHMLDEELRLFFMHFWAKHHAVMLAKGMHAALDETKRGAR